MTGGKKKLCIVLPSHWAAQIGGAEHQVRLLLDYLTTLDLFEITYIAKNVANSFIPEGYKIIKIKTKHRIDQFGKIGDTLSLLSILRQVKPDTIYQRVGCAYTGISAFYAKKYNCKSIWHISHDTEVSPTGWRKRDGIGINFFEKKLLEYGIKNSSVIIAQTKNQAELLSKNYNLNPKLIVPNFHSTPLVNKKTGQFISIVWVANFKPWKRPEIFIQLAKHFSSKKNVRFIMVGRAGKSTWHKKIIEEINNNKNIEYLGEVSVNKVNDIFSQADILVNTSIYEGFPNTFIQAWLQEIPVVSMNINPDNILDEQSTGYCVHSYKNMITHLNSLISNTELRVQMGKKARQYALLNHSEKNISKIIGEFKI